MTLALRALDLDLAAVPGTVSVWCGPLGAAVPAYQRLADAPHYAASTMKLAVLAALYGGGFDLDTEIPIVDEFASAAPGAPRFRLRPAAGQDDEVAALRGGTASPRWLARRMIVTSSNLAADLLLDHVGLAACAEVLRAAGATHSRIERGIEDTAALRAGLTNEVTARDLAALLHAIAAAPAAGEMLDVLLAQQRREDLAAGLPPGTRVAHKNGWVTGVRHAVGVIFPLDAPPYTLAVCTTTSLARAGGGDDACALVARIAAASWADRRSLGGP